VQRLEDIFLWFISASIVVAMISHKTFSENWGIEFICLQVVLIAINKLIYEHRDAKQKTQTNRTN